MTAITTGWHQMILYAEDRDCDNDPPTERGGEGEEEALRRQGSEVLARESPEDRHGWGDWDGHYDGHERLADNRNV